MKWCTAVAILVLAASATIAVRFTPLPHDKAQSDPAALAATIDRHLGDRLKANKVSPAPLADDASFFRRANLTLAGRIPVAADVRAFVADQDPLKRQTTISRLFDSEGYANHFTAAWRGWLLPEAATNLELAGAVPAFEAWLRSRIQANMPFDKFVNELLTAPLSGRPVPGQRAEADDPDGRTSPLAFYTAKGAKPENLAAATSRVFLGVQLECAQCHDHPFASWSRDQFWGLAAFFSGIERSDSGGLREVFDRREMLIPNSDRAVPATFLDDRAPEWRFKESPRATLAKWMTAPDNRFFARAAVNRLWGFVFGVGLVDPVDDFHEKNPPSHPELLDALAQAFVDSGFDTRFLLRAICLSNAFQRSSAALDAKQRDVRLYARFPVQGLSPEQLFDSLALAIDAEPEKPDGANLPNPGSPRRQFLETFASTGRMTDNPTSIVQALMLMNGNLVGAGSALGSSRTLTQLLDQPALNPAARVEELYLATLSRQPRPLELQRTIVHLETGGPDEQKQRYADVLWALLNGIEFRTNH